MDTRGSRRLVFYLLASETEAIESAQQRYEAKHLVGHKADFWADIAPYLTVLEVEDFMSQATRVEGEGLSEPAREELDRIRSWVRRWRQPIVGYQLEVDGPV